MYQLFIYQNQICIFKIESGVERTNKQKQKQKQNNQNHVHVFHV